MRKVRVVQWTRPNGMWFVETPQGNLIVRGWDEAMFLAQLLADPHEYLRAAQDKAWERGKQTEILDGLCLDFSGTRVGSTPSPYRKVTQ